MTTPHPLVERLITVTRAQTIALASIEAFEAEPGAAVLYFGGDPVRFPEALDVAVVLPELRAYCGGFRVGVVAREAEDALARRYAVQRWPSLVVVRDGGYLGTLSGMKDWDDYLRELRALLAGTPGRRPLPAIAVHASGAACH